VVTQLLHACRPKAKGQSIRKKKPKGAARPPKRVRIVTVIVIAYSSYIVYEKQAKDLELEQVPASQHQHQ